MSDPVFLDADDVLLIHEEQLGEYRGSAGVRDLGLLQSAVAIPRATAGGRVAVGVLCIVCACAGRVPQHHASAGTSELVRTLRAHHPEYRWDAATVIIGDVTGDAVDDVAAVGRDDTGAGAVVGVAAAMREPQTWVVKVERPRYGPCGGRDINLSLEGVAPDQR